MLPAVTAVSARVWQRCASNISLNLGPPNHDSITVYGCLLKVIGRVMLPFAIGSKTSPFEAHVIQDLISGVRVSCAAVSEAVQGSI